MRRIICPRCKNPAVGPAPDHKPIVMGRFSSTEPIVVKCGRCTDSFKLSPTEFFRLPVEPEEAK